MLYSMEWNQEIEERCLRYMVDPIKYYNMLEQEKEETCLKNLSWWKKYRGDKCDIRIQR